jgi:hypothetical protein
MESKDVRAVLELLGMVDPLEDVPSFGGNRSIKSIGIRHEMISRLMNVTLQCLGTIRKLIIENEKVRIHYDSTDIDGSLRNTGEDSLLERQIFARAANTMLEGIVQGKELHLSDPMKDLVDSYPWAHTLASPHWLMMNWTLMERHLNAEKSEADHLETVKRALKYFPNTLAEVDKFGQHYVTYAIRSQSIPLLEEVLHYHNDGALILDGKGKQAIHYASHYSQSVEALIVIAEVNRKPLREVLQTVDDYGNTPLHLAAAGLSSHEVLKEILFSLPDAIRIKNNDGLLPLHIAAGKASVEVVGALVSAFPTAISVTDKNGWLPLHHAAYDNKHVEVIKYIHEAYPKAMTIPQASSGRLPLHYATVKCWSSKVIQYLLEVFPDAAKSFDVHRRLPLHNLIARCEHMTPARLRCLRLLLDVYPHAVTMCDEGMIVKNKK